MARPRMQTKIAPWPKHVDHCETGKPFVVTGFAPGGNMERDYLRLRPVLKNGRLGKSQVRVSSYYCPAKGTRWERYAAMIGKNRRK